VKVGKKSKLSRNCNGFAIQKLGVDGGARMDSPEEKLNAETAEGETATATRSTSMDE